jgi:hypothetical protein
MRFDGVFSWYKAAQIFVGYQPERGSSGLVVTVL